MDIRKSSVDGKGEISSLGKTEHESTIETIRPEVAPADTTTDCTETGLVSEFASAIQEATLSAEPKDGNRKRSRDSEDCDAEPSASLPSPKRHCAEADFQPTRIRSIAASVDTLKDCIKEELVSASVGDSVKDCFPLDEKSRKRSRDSELCFESFEALADHPSPKRTRIEADSGIAQIPIRLSAEHPADNSSLVRPSANVEDGNTKLHAPAETAVDYWRRNHVWPENYWGAKPTMPFLPIKKSDFPSVQKSANSSDDDFNRLSSTDSYVSEGRAAHNIYLVDYKSKDGREDGISTASKKICRTLRGAKYPSPQNTLFDKDIYYKTCEKLLERNEARIVQDITRLLVPSAEALSLREKELEILVESVNERWFNCISILKTRPQPDHAVGYNFSAFNDFQMKKLGPYLGNAAVDLSYARSTERMLFPFLTCEVKSNLSTAFKAEAQNDHSIAVAITGVVELFREVGRESELHREILAFSVRHDARDLTVYGHYPVIDGDKTSFYRHEVFFHRIGVEAGNSRRSRWKSYQLVKAIYHIWAPKHLKRLCSAIEQLPDRPLD